MLIGYEQPIRLSRQLFEVVAAGLHHFVLHPAAVFVDEETGRLRRLEFVFRNGASETLVLN